MICFLADTNTMEEWRLELRQNLLLAGLLGLPPTMSSVPKVEGRHEEKEANPVNTPVLNVAEVPILTVIASLTE